MIDKRDILISLLQAYSLGILTLDTSSLILVISLRFLDRESMCTDSAVLCIFIFSILPQTIKTERHYNIPFP